MEGQLAGSPVAFKARVMDRSQVMYRLALFALVACSLGLRLFALGWGIPNFNPSRMAQSAYRNSYHIDEDNFIWGLMQMRPSQLNFDVVDYHWGTLQYFLIYGALLGGEAVGVIPSPWEQAFQEGNIDAIPRIYELGRLVSVAAGMAGVLVLVTLGTLVGGRRAGLGAGVAYALAPLAVVEAHYLTSDVLVSVLVAASVLVSVLAIRRGRTSLLVLAGLLLGLAIAAKYSGVFAAPALLTAQWLAWREGVPRRDEGREFAARRAPRSSNGDPAMRTKSTALQARVTQNSTPASGYPKTQSSFPRIWLLPWLAMTGGFVIGEPYALIVPEKLLTGIRSTVDGNAMDVSWGLEPPFRMITWQLGNLAWLGLTLPLALLALGGAGVMVARLLRGWRVRRRMDEGSSAATAAILLVAIVGIVLGLGLNRVFMLRYSQPLVPLLAVLAGVGWASIGRPTLQWAAGAAAVAVAGVVTLGQLSIMAGPHPANDLLAWLDAHVKPGQQVARLWPEYPPLDGGDIKLVRLDPWRPAMPAGADPDYIIMDNMMLGPADPSLTDLIGKKYREVVRFSVQPHIGPFSWDEGTTPHDWKYSHPTFVVYTRGH